MMFHNMAYAAIGGKLVHQTPTDVSNPKWCLKPWLVVTSRNASKFALTFVQDVLHLHARLANSTAAGLHGNAPLAQPHDSWMVEASPRKLEQDFSHASLQPPSANGNDWHPVKAPSRPTTYRHGQSSTNGNVPFAANGKPPFSLRENGWVAANGSGNGQFSTKENSHFSTELDGHPRQVSPQLDGHPRQLSPQPQLSNKQKGAWDPCKAKY